MALHKFKLQHTELIVCLVPMSVDLDASLYISFNQLKMFINRSLIITSLIFFLSIEVIFSFLKRKCMLE